MKLFNMRSAGPARLSRARKPQAGSETTLATAELKAVSSNGESEPADDTVWGVMNPNGHTVDMVVGAQTLDAEATCKKRVNLGATHNVQTNLFNEMALYILEQHEFPNGGDDMFVRGRTVGQEVTLHMRTDDVDHVLVAPVVLRMVLRLKA